jgi:hypothetical protein
MRGANTGYTSRIDKQAAEAQGDSFHNNTFGGAPNVLFVFFEVTLPVDDDDSRVSIAAQQHRIAPIFLASAFFVLGKTIPAIHGAIVPGFKRNFAFLFAVGTDSLKHLSRTSIELSILKSHFLFLHDTDIFRDIDC